MSNRTDLVLTPDIWNPESHRYMNVKTNDKGGKSINIISTQSGRMTHISTPLMMTWGVSDFVDEKGDSKFSVALNFPNEEYRTKGTDALLEKMKRFENKILDDAVENSEQWWGRKMSREVCSYSMFPFLKYPKNKETKQTDYTKAPTIRAKVPFYDNKWGVEIYDLKDNMIFPCGDENTTPIEFIPERSSVACVLQCGGIWIGGKGWGVTWKLIQCVVKPREIMKVQGRCRIQLSDEDRKQIENDSVEEPDVSPPPPPVSSAKVSTQPPPVEYDTQVNDSDDEYTESYTAPEDSTIPDMIPESQPEPIATPIPELEPELDPAVDYEPEPEPEPEPELKPKPIVKKVVAKSADPEPVKKKVVKKKVEA